MLNVLLVIAICIIGGICFKVPEGENVYIDNNNKQYIKTTFLKKIINSADATIINKEINSLNICYFEIIFKVNGVNYITLMPVMKNMYNSKQIGEII